VGLFGKDRDREQRAGLSQPSPGSADRTPREVEMFERDQAAREQAMMRATDGGTLTAFLGKSTRISGTLVFEGPTRIEGHVEGEVSAAETLTVGETAIVNARITGALIVIQGTVTGDVTAHTRLEIRAPGKVIGDVTTPSLVINEGAILEGRCSMRSATPAEATGVVPSSPPTATSLPPTAKPSQLQAG
jgi:cytoskeletal protein CcmA (bactofilin family)